MAKRMNTKDVTAKFCKAAAPGNVSECEIAATELLSAASREAVTDALNRLVEITGKNENDIVNILYKSCPLCPSPS